MPAGTYFRLSLLRRRMPVPHISGGCRCQESRNDSARAGALNELFDRLAKLENNSRDRDAERLIADGLRQAPHAVYALVQTALVQDEALKLANARIEELQAQAGGPEQHQRCTEVLQAAITMRWDAYGQNSLGRSMPGNGHLAPPPR